MQNGFQRCPNEYMLYTKYIDPRDVCTVCLYVNDLIFTRNNSKMIAKFWEAMIKHFEMTNMGLMSYFVVLRSFNKIMGFSFSKRNMLVVF